MNWRSLFSRPEPRPETIEVEITVNGSTQLLYMDARKTQESFALGYVDREVRGPVDVYVVVTRVGGEIPVEDLDEGRDDEPQFEYLNGRQVGARDPEYPYDGPVEVEQVGVRDPDYPYADGPVEVERGDAYPYDEYSQAARDRDFPGRWEPKVRG